MEDQKQNFQHILLFYYRKVKNAFQAKRKLCDLFGEDVLTERQCQFYSNLPNSSEDVEGRVVLMEQRINVLEEKMKTRSQLQNEMVGLGEKADRLENMSMANELNEIKYSL